MAEPASAQVKRSVVKDLDRAPRAWREALGASGFAGSHRCLDGPGTNGAALGGEPAIPQALRAWRQSLGSSTAGPLASRTIRSAIF